MRFRLYREYGAQNSRPVFDALEEGLKALGHEIVTDTEDISVIWSVLWAGKMKPNMQIYKNCISSGKPVLIVELVACQHHESLQWEGMPALGKWASDTVNKIKQHTNRRIIVRPHPRSPFPFSMPNIILEKPQRIPNTYDSFNIFYNYHCVINHNAGPAVQAAIEGVPVLCDSSSLAAPLSIKWEDLENPYLPDREEWFLKLCHTEWTVDEIRQGIPLARLFR